MIRALPLSVAIAFFASAPQLEGAQLCDYDMASLWYMSQVVIEGEVLGQGKVRVTLVHKGRDRVGAGDEIPVALATFSRTLYWQEVEVNTKQVLLFLNWNEQGNHYLPAQCYLSVASGIKLIVDAEDVVYRLEQYDNPGPYVLVRQGPELIDRSGLARREVSKEYEAAKETFPGDDWESHAYVYGRSALRRDLQLAEQRVEQFHKALSAKDIDALESFLPSPLPMAILSDREGRVFVRINYDNVLASAAATEVVKHAEDARIAAILEKHKPHLTYQVLVTLERALASKRAGAP